MWLLDKGAPVPEHHDMKLYKGCGRKAPYILDFHLELSSCSKKNPV